jgi:HK97 family phage major capsid protein
MLFGALSKYMIRDVTGSTMVTFQERFMENFQIGWVHFMRSDGALLVASTRTASKPVKHLKGTT